MLKIVLADDHVLVRQGLRSLLEGSGFEVVGEASDGWEAIEMAKMLQPQIAILDLAMPRLNGVDAGAEIVRLPGAETKVILLTMHTEEAYVRTALAAGLSGYVLKSKAAVCLITAIREVAQGNIYLSPTISRSVVDRLRANPAPPTDPLSSRERQVLQLVAEGMSSKEIANQLSITVKTAESHRTRIMQKLGIHETASLVRYAIRQGIIQP